MVTDFPTALHFVLYQEGVRWAADGATVVDSGYVNAPADPGGETNYGITAREYSRWLAAIGETDARSIKDISYTEVSTIYERDYWRSMQCHRFVATTPGLALCTFDFGVNAGTARGAMFLQAALDGRLTVDGVIGPLTLNAIARLTPVTLPIVISRYLRLRAAFYRVRADMPDAAAESSRLGANGLARIGPHPDATQQVFVSGWLARVRAVAHECGVPVDPSFAKIVPPGSSDIA